MEKEEESEKHLQDILDAQSNATATHTTAEIDTLVHLVIPIPEVFEGDAQQVYKDVYAGNYKVRPFTSTPQKKLMISAELYLR